MSERKYRLLLAEDDQNLGILLSDFLGTAGYEVCLCRDGEQALSAFRSKVFDICLLDIMMPRMDGFSVAREIRKTSGLIPLIFITAKSMKEDKWKGYTLGADDFITKPFDEEELLWKIGALIRRTAETAGTTPAGPVRLGRFVFDAANHSLVLDGKTRRITGRECEILNYLSENRNRVIRREEILKELWGENDYFLGRSLDVFITKIRKYLRDDPAVSVANVFGIGFIFNVPDPPG